MGRLNLRPPEPNPAQIGVHHWIRLDDHATISAEQKLGVDRLPVSLATISSLQSSFSKKRLRAHEAASGNRSEEQRRPLARSPTGDIHPKVSVSPSSRLTMVP
jgi:hypothetical protein